MVNSYGAEDEKLHYSLVHLQKLRNTQENESISVRLEPHKTFKTYKEAQGCEVPDYYYKGRLMIAYLMNIRHLSYDQILKDGISENVIFQEMIKWTDSTRAIQN